jgi:hypothetical protein
MPTITATQGMDFTLPTAPQLTEAPLSLLSEARTLVDLSNLVARRQAASERLASATQMLDEFDGGAGVAGVGGVLIPSEEDSASDAREALAQQVAEWEGTVAALDATIAVQQRFEEGFRYLPELSNDSSMETFVPFSGLAKDDDDNQTAYAWYEPFVAVARDKRSTFGWPAADFAARIARAIRSLEAHECWQVEREWWGGNKIPTNYHLTASSHSLTTSPKYTLSAAWPDPTPCPTTVLGTAVGMAQSLASLDQAIADADAGTGMIHATPYVMQKWMQTYPFLRDAAGNVRTVNNNILVPGYGYGGTGPDRTSRTVTDGVLNSTTTVTSATASFSASYDIGMPISGGSIPKGAVIVSVTNTTTVVISAPAGGSATGVHLTLPGYGGRATSSLKQWAYATDLCYSLMGDIITYPHDFREMSPDLTVDNSVPVRAERNHAIITNQLLRAAVLIDTTQA